MPVKAGYLFILAGGGVFVWSGLKGKSVSSVFRQLAGGDSPTAAMNANTVTGATSTSTSTGTSTNTGDTGASSASAAANQAIAKPMAAAYGWTGQQWLDLIALWNQESSWSTTAVNPSTGATGIPQLNPADYTIPADWTSAAVQIAWGLAYIASRYGSPSAAWQHEVNDGWY